ncbi:MAG TPA: serine hydrolase domain-containing protein, partial [Deinococcales bacterium]|nr:serine hydrolase domain-containing protein [Deinococcales bacterium]
MFHSTFRRLAPLCLALLTTFGFAQAPVAPTAPAPVQEQEPADPSSADVWQGAIEIPGMPLEVTIRLNPEAAGWQGSIDIPAQGATDMPLGDIAITDDEATFAIIGIPGDPVFKGTIEGDQLTGTFTQSGQEFPFSLTRMDAADVPATDEYEDPEGRFTVTVPTGWTAAGEDGYAHLASPAGGINVYLLVSEGDDLEAAVAAAWTTVDPDLQPEPADTMEPPSQSGIERTVLVNYESGDGDRFFQALVQLHDGTAYTMLIEGDLAALQRRNAQLQIVATSFRISELERTDLSEVEPRPVTDVIAELEPFITQNLEAFGIPGAAISIVQGGEVVWDQGFGVREIGGNEPLTPDTHMMIGSTGKTMTSMLVATLVDDGIISWDTPVVEVLPEFAVADPELTGEITFRNLLCACTGVPRRDF